jgi:hypothetical protein
MNHSRILGLALLLSVLLSSCSRRHFPSSYIIVPATVLESHREEWIKQNRSPAYDVSRFAKPLGTYFNFTNTVSAGGRDYKCLFGARREDWPPGILAITEDGIILWVGDQDGKVALSPEVNGVDW